MSLKLVGLLAVFAWAVPGGASEGGALSGTITDPSGAVIAGVSVELQNSPTALRKTSVTGTDGSYNFPDLAPGRYELRVDCSGFQPYRRAGIDIAANAALELDMVLELAGQQAAIVVTEASVDLDTSTTQAGEVIQASKMTAVPLNGRSFTDLLALQPGIVPANSQQPNAVIMAGVASTPPSGGFSPGGHDVSYWRQQLPAELAWMSS